MGGWVEVEVVLGRLKLSRYIKMIWILDILSLNPRLEIKL